jgi:hypothetical protein
MNRHKRYRMKLKADRLECAIVWKDLARKRWICV